MFIPNFPWLFSEVYSLLGLLELVRNYNTSSLILNAFVNVKIISRLYKSFQESLKANTLPVQNKWERGGGMEISEDEWEIYVNPSGQLHLHTVGGNMGRTMLEDLSSPLPRRDIKVLEWIARSYVEQMWATSIIYFGIAPKLHHTLGEKALTRKWLQDVPSLEEQLNIIYEIYTMERWIFSTKMQTEKCRE